MLSDVVFNFSCYVTIVVPSLVCSNIDSFGVIICYNLVTGNTPPKIFFHCFLEIKISASWEYVLSSKSATRELIWLNLANLLSDSFSKKLCLWILISFFIFELEYFFTGSATILDKTVEKIVYLDSCSCTGSSLSPFPWKQCCCVFKRKPDPWAFVGSNIESGEGVFFPQRRRFGNSFVA